MKHSSKGLIICATALISSPVYIFGQNQKQNFEEFRKEIFSNYKEFRNTLLEQYADFLNGEWHEYQSLKGERKYTEPKPAKAPVAVEPEPYPEPIGPEDIPHIYVPDIAEEPEATPPAETPVITETPPPAETPVIVDFPLEKPVISIVPDTEELPLISPRPESAPTAQFSFYEIPVEVPRVEFNILGEMATTSDYAQNWQLLADADVANRTVPLLTKAAALMGLNDYLTFQLVKSYVESTFPEHPDSPRFSTIHYLLANMGYDARIAETSDGTPLLLIPFDQNVYARSYMLLDGQRYYIFAPDSFNMDLLGSKTILTCRIPDNVEHGRPFGLIVGELNIPYDPYPFELKGANLKLSGEINRNLIPILYRYPQMEIDGFARSNLQPELREDLTRQLREQLAGMKDRDAVNSLLKFTQKAFQYATDEDNHGFEKPYFLEESLYYPKNDCEDRAIFYTYFLWNALGKEAQLISFPGHEAATVNMGVPINGTSYEYKGETFYISDPTYIGASTGMVMPCYRDETPEIDYTYE